MPQRLPVCRVLIESDPRSGQANMDFDEWLLNQSAVHAFGGDAILRWYRWSEPTISLGYFQEDDPFPPGDPLGELPRVRRLSGGGAILHDQEWTYSLTLPPSQRLVRQPHHLYELVHTVIIDALKAHGVEARLRGETFKQAVEPSLCFSRGDENDIVLMGHKIVGSAQRRRKGALLQHGSLILRRADLAPQFPGVLDLASTLREWSVDSTRHLAGQLAARIGESTSNLSIDSRPDMNRC